MLFFIEGFLLTFRGEGMLQTGSNEKKTLSFIISSLFILNLVAMEICAKNSSSLNVQSARAFNDTPSGYWWDEMTSQNGTSNHVRLLNTTIMNEFKESSNFPKNDTSPWIYNSTSTSSSSSSTSSSSSSSSSSTLSLPPASSSSPTTYPSLSPSSSPSTFSPLVSSQQNKNPKSEPLPSLSSPSLSSPSLSSSSSSSPLSSYFSETSTSITPSSTSTTVVKSTLLPTPSTSSLSSALPPPSSSSSSSSPSSSLSSSSPLVTMVNFGSDPFTRHIGIFSVALPSSSSSSPSSSSSLSSSSTLSSSSSSPPSSSSSTPSSASLSPNIPSQDISKMSTTFNPQSSSQPHDVESQVLNQPTALNSYPLDLRNNSHDPHLNDQRLNISRTFRGKNNKIGRSKNFAANNNNKFGNNFSKVSDDQNFDTTSTENREISRSELLKKSKTHKRSGENRARSRSLKGQEVNRAENYDELNTILDFNGGSKKRRNGGGQKKQKERNVVKLKDYHVMNQYPGNVLWRGRNISRISYYDRHHHHHLQQNIQLQQQHSQHLLQHMQQHPQHFQYQQQFVANSSSTTPFLSNDINNYEFNLQHNNNNNNRDYHKNSISSRFKGYKHLPDCPVLPPCHCPGKLSMKVKVTCERGKTFPNVVAMNSLIKSVSIAYADLVQLPDFALEPLRIDELDLQGNNFGFRIGSKALSGVGKQLISLNLAWCNITRLPSKLFKGMTSLRNLSLAENHIKRIFPLTFKDLVNLERLSLSGNPLFEINAELLRYQSSLRHLDIGYCKLEKLYWNSFNGLWRLETLDLRGNQLKILDPYSFSDLTSLQVLYLGHNLLKKLDAKSLSGLKSLRLLNLAESKLKEIDRDAFVDMKQLEELNLSDNKLRYLHVGTLLLPRLQILLLDGNQLSRLPNEITYLPALKHLDLSYNRIKTIDKCLLFDHLQLETLNLRENPFHCDCSMFWLRETKVRLLKRWTERKRGLPFIPGNCWTPSHFRGISVTEWLSMECVMKNMEENDIGSSCHKI